MPGWGPTAEVADGGIRGDVVGLAGVTAIAVTAVVAGHGETLADQGAAGIDAVDVDVAQRAAVAILAIAGSTRRRDGLSEHEGLHPGRCLGRAAHADLWGVDPDDAHSDTGREIDGVAVDDVGDRDDSWGWGDGSTTVGCALTEEDERYAEGEQLRGPRTRRGAPEGCR